MTIAIPNDVIDAEVIPSYDDAHQGTQNMVRAAENFRDAQNEFTGLVRRAYVDNWYVGEGFEFSQAGWQQYLDKYVGPVLAGIKGAERVRLVAGFTEIGMSTRVQAAVLKVNQSTVVRDQKASDASASQDKPKKPVVVKGSDGRKIDPENPTRFTCAKCGKRKPFQGRVEFQDELYCEPCAEAVEQALAHQEAEAAKEPEPEPKPPTFRETLADLNRRLRAVEKLVLTPAQRKSLIRALEKSLKTIKSLEDQA